MFGYTGCVHNEEEGKKSINMNEKLKIYDNVDKIDLATRLIEARSE